MTKTLTGYDVMVYNKDIWTMSYLHSKCHYRANDT